MGIIFLFLMLLPVGSFSQQWISLNKHLSNYKTENVYFIDNNTGFILLRNEVWKTTDAGRNFYNVYSAPSPLFWQRLKQFFVFGNNVVITGDDRIIRSADLGETFTENIYSIKMYHYFFIDANRGWGLRNDGLFYLRRTTDGGVTWTTTALPVQPNDFHFTDSLKGFMTSKTPGVKSFYRTTNGGVTWISVYAGISLQNAAIAFFNSSIGYVAASDTAMYTSDGGNSWNLRPSKKILKVKNGVGITYDYYIPYKETFYTTDFGETWKELFVPIKNQEIVFDIISPTTFLIGSFKGALYRTTTAGDNWEAVTPPSFNLSNGFFIDDRHGWLNGEHLMRTTDGGYNWDIIFLKERLTRVWFIDKYKGFSVLRSSLGYNNNTNYRHKLLKTTDQGDTWDTVFAFNSNWDYRYLYFKNNLNGFLLGGTTFAVTDDGGETWDFSNPHNLSGIKILFLDSLKWYVSGYNSGFRTVDGGNNWLPLPAIGGHDLFVVDTMKLWKAAGYGLFRSTDGGLSFSTVYDHGQTCSFSTITFLNPEEGYTIWHQHNVIMKTTNGGNNWFGFFSTSGNDIMENYSMVIRSSRLIYVFGDSCKILKYTDDVVPVELSTFLIEVKDKNVHINWSTASETNNKGFRLLRIKEEKEDEITFIQGAGNSVTYQNYSHVDRSPGNGMFIYKLIQEDFDGTRTELGEKNILIDLPFEFILHQNYPNPFNPVTHIRYSIPEANNTKLVIYDALGREASVLLNEVKEPGSYEEDFNGSTFPSGVYFYKLSSGSFTSTKKFLLVK
jgi:photosystem II stability/assembly factor-like uncharacterized protein